MPATTTVVTRWDPSRLNRAITGAFPKSVKVAQVDATRRLHNHSKSSVGARITNSTNAVLYGKGLTSVFEGGRQGGYEINPSGATGIRRSYSRKTSTATYKSRAGSGDKFALKFVGGDGGFAAYAIGGSMQAYPAMGPAGQDWARRGYQTVARAELRSKGFR